MLLQVGSKIENPVKKVVQTLKHHAQKAQSLRLAALASQIRTKGHFDMVVEQVVKMENVLKAEEKQDMETKDWCKEETFKNEEEASKFEHKVQKENAKVASLEDKIIAMEGTVKETVSEME